MTKSVASTVLILLMYTFLSGCSASSSDMAGTVVDVETGNSIEGAVVLVEWTITKGIGLTHTESYKVIEIVTDREGRFKAAGVLNPLVNAPDVTIYKKGYVAWNSRIIFPDYRNRSDFKWGNAYTFKCDHFRPEYSYVEHTAFLSSAINSSIGSKEMIKNAYYWEELEASEERNKKAGR